jgi:hypothetical protein
VSGETKLLDRLIEICNFKSAPLYESNEDQQELLVGLVLLIELRPASPGNAFVSPYASCALCGAALIVFGNVPGLSLAVIALSAKHRRPAAYFECGFRK